VIADQSVWKRGRSTVSATAAYLRELIRAYLSGATVAVAPAVTLDWARLVELLRRHHLIGALGPLLPLAALPEAVQTELQRDMHACGLRTTLMLLELERLLPRLQARDCSPIVLKGAALATDYYPRPEQRWFMDLDLLVPEAALERSVTVLADLGYSYPEGILSARHYRQHHFHYVLRNEQQQYLEVHWALTLPDSVYRCDPEQLQARAVEQPLGGIAARVPAPVDLFLHGVMQGLWCGFDDARRLLDAALVARRFGPVDLEQLVTLAHEERMATGVWLQYQLLDEVCGIAPPAAVMAALQPAAGTRRWLARLPLAEICLEGKSEYPEAYSRLLHLLSTPAGPWRRRELRRYFMPPPAELSEMGFDPEHPPHALRRLKIAAGRLRSLLKLAWVLLRSSSARR
jgi:hypothetical protein